MVKKDSLLIFFIGVVVFTLGLSPEFLGFDCRFAVFAQEMLRNGPTFFPTTYGQPYPDYPATLTFLIYLASLPFGKVTPFTATLPTAIGSTLVLVVIYRIGVIRSRQWGVLAVLLALFTIKFFTLSRSLSIDQYISLATSLCFFVIYSATEYNKYKRLWFIPLLFVASFAFRGPIGLVIPAAVVCAYYFFEKNFKLFAVMALTAIVLFVVCFYGLLHAAAYQGGAAFADDVWKMQMAGRMGEARHWIGYYWTESFFEYAIAYPFAVIVVIANFKKIFKRENADYRLLACLAVWILVVLIGMSVPGTKKIRYVLPMMPAAALVAAYMFVVPLQKDFLSGVRRIFLGFCLWFPAGAFIGIGVLWLVVWKRHLAFDAYYIPTLAVMTILAVGGRWLDTRLKEGFAKEVAMMSIGIATFIGITIGIAEPINFDSYRTGPFVEKVVTLQKQQPGDIVFYKISADGDAIKFMANLDKPIKPQFINSPEAIVSCKELLYFIAREKDFADLPKEVARHIKRLDSGQIGNDDCVIFNIGGSLQP
jgi:hypothetical protein